MSPSECRQILWYYMITQATVLHDPVFPLQRERQRARNNGGTSHPNATATHKADVKRSTPQLIRHANAEEEKPTCLNMPPNKLRSP